MTNATRTNHCQDGNGDIAIKNGRHPSQTKSAGGGGDGSPTELSPMVKAGQRAKVLNTIKDTPEAQAKGLVPLYKVYDNAGFDAATVTDSLQTLQSQGKISLRRMEDPADLRADPGLQRIGLNVATGKIQSTSSLGRDDIRYYARVRS